MPENASPWFVAVGASGAEGLNDIIALLTALPPSIPAVILVVLHRSWDKPSNLKFVLERSIVHQVFIAEEGNEFKQSTVYIGEPDRHLTLATRSLGGMVDDPNRVYGNRTVDLLFRSVARYGKGRMIGIVLSGSLDDGSRGLAAIHEAGGLTMVLTPDPMPYQGMPENAISYDGPIDVIGSPRVIAAAIVETVTKG
ncbi:chemotaxis protein CheB [Methylobacterium sp. E-045]|uniref:chemotaxis protein CheB n=1 Tax=Methylobacterium sp. E-045 TaxID=2836575 RepID=UPI001FBAD722|nr:chemotaxis protein CheB [Methylobacterium sp. E-045]MCJ2131319.1 chemotaxis protein CheB [Methylobacterium sp. E-045]